MKTAREAEREAAEADQVRLSNDLAVLAEEVGSVSDARLILNLLRRARAADQEAAHHPDYGRACHCEGAAKAYRHAAELVRQAREGR